MVLIFIFITPKNTANHFHQDKGPMFVDTSRSHEDLNTSLASSEHHYTQCTCLWAGKQIIVGL